MPGSMVALTTVMIVAATLAVGTRLYARKLRNVKYSWDDYTIVAALVCAETTLRFHNTDARRFSHMVLRSVCTLVSRTVTSDITLRLTPRLACPF
jgi:hypothetical protein